MAARKYQPALYTNLAATISTRLRPTCNYSRYTKASSNPPPPEKEIPQTRPHFEFNRPHCFKLNATAFICATSSQGSHTPTIQQSLEPSSRVAWADGWGGAVNVIFFPFRTLRDNYFCNGKINIVVRWPRATVFICWYCFSQKEEDAETVVYDFIFCV